MGKSDATKKYNKKERIKERPKKKERERERERIKIKREREREREEKNEPIPPCFSVLAQVSS